MKPALYLALLLANFLQQPSGPTAITSGGHSIFYGPQEKPLSASATCDPKKNTCITTATTITSGNTLTMPEPEAHLSDPIMKDGRKVYTLDLKPDWTCRPSSNFVGGGNLLYPTEPTLVILTCVKSDAAPERSAK